MIRDVVLRYMFTVYKDEGNNYNPKLYIKLDWEPPESATSTENKVDTFKNKRTLLTSTLKSNSANLTIFQKPLI